MVTAPGAEAGWNSTVPPGGGSTTGSPRPTRSRWSTTSALRHAGNVTAPLLVCVCDRENLMDPQYAALVAQRAPRGVATPLRLRPLRRSTIRRWSARCSPTRPPSSRSTSMSMRELLRSNDLRFLAVAATLGADEWAAPSLCDEWTNHEVLAHLVVGYGCAARCGRRRDVPPPRLVRRRQHRDGVRTGARGHPPNCSTTSRDSSNDRRASAGTFRGGCCSATTSPTNSTSCLRSTASPPSPRMRSSRC